MDVRALLHNRWALGGVGVAAVAGLVVFLRRRKAAGAAGGSTTVAQSPGYVSTGIGGFDSTGTDVAAWLGNQQGFLDNQFKEFTTGVDSRLAAIQAEHTTGTVGVGTVTTTPAPKTTARYDYATRYPSQKGTLSGIAAANKTTVSALRKLNPNITNPDLIFAGQKIRVA